MPLVMVSLVGVFAAAENGTPNGTDNNFDVQPQRPVFDIPQIILGTLGDGGITSQTVDLRPAGHASFLAMTFHVTRNTVTELEDINRTFRTRPNQTHLADEYINQLGDFIPIGTTH